jgi:hypothetical protein
VLHDTHCILLLSAQVPQQRQHRRHSSQAHLGGQTAAAAHLAGVVGQSHYQQLQLALVSPSVWSMGTRAGARCQSMPGERLGMGWDVLSHCLLR